MAVTFQGFSDQVASVEPSMLDSLSHTFNGDRMGNSAIIGALGGAFNETKGAGLATVLAGGFNGYLNSNDDSFLGKAFDGVKGMVEAYAVKKIVESVPKEYQSLAAIAIGVLGKTGGVMMSNTESNNELLIQQEMMNNPAVSMMVGSGRNALLDAARESSKENYSYVQDKDIRNHFKMT